MHSRFSACYVASLRLFQTCPSLCHNIKFRSRNQLYDHVIEICRTSALAHDYDTEAAQQPQKQRSITSVEKQDRLEKNTAAIRVTKQEQQDFQHIKKVSPEFLPPLNADHRDRIANKLERIDMLRRRQRISIPEFYVGSILAVTMSDKGAPDKKMRFVGLCTERWGEGLRAMVRLRNCIEGEGVEMVYELYSPFLLKIEVLRLEQRLDSDLLYLRDAPSLYSTVPFDLRPMATSLSRGVPVKVNDMKVPLNELPWQQRWDIRGYAGVILPDLPYSWLKRRWRHFRAHRHLMYEKFDLMKRYRDTVHDFDAIDMLEQIKSEKDVAHRSVGMHKKRHGTHKVETDSLAS